MVTNGCSENSDDQFLCVLMDFRMATNFRLLRLLESHQAQRFAVCLTLFTVVSTVAVSPVYEGIFQNSWRVVVACEKITSH